MNGGRKNKLSVRKAVFQRQREQYPILNSLRLAYFLSPLKLKKEGITDASPTYIYRILEKIFKRQIGDRSLPWGGPGSFTFSLEDYINSQKSLKEVYKHGATRSQIFGAENKRRLVDSPYIPKNTYLTYAGKNIKTRADFNKFIVTVILFQNFELMKLEKGEGNNANKFYLDIFKNKYPDWVKSQALRDAHKKAKKRKSVAIRELKRSNGEVTDRVIARTVYGSTSPKAQQLVRQTRRRLRQYNLL